MYFLFISIISFKCIQLCELLNVKEDIVSTIPTPVEPAFEANEIALNTNTNTKTPGTKQTVNPQQQHAVNTIPAATTTATATASAATTPTIARTVADCVPAPSGTIPIQVNASRQANKIDHDARIRREFVRKLKIECDNYGTGMGANGINVRASAQNEKDDAANGARYEVPEMNLSQTAVRIIGDRKELEMHEFSAKVPMPQSAYTVGRTVNIPIVDPSGDRSSNDQ